MDSIDQHHTIQKTNQAKSLLKENLDPTLKSKSLNEKSYIENSEGLQEHNGNIGTPCKNEGKCIKTGFVMKTSPACIGISTREQSIIFNKSIYTPPTSPSKITFDNNLIRSALRTPKHETVFFRNSGISTKRLSNCIPFSVTKRRKTSTNKGLVELKTHILGHNQTNGSPIRQTGGLVRSHSQRSFQRYQKSRLRPLSMPSFQALQTPILELEVSSALESNFGNVGWNTDGLINFNIKKCHDSENPSNPLNSEPDNNSTVMDIDDDNSSNYSNSACYPVGEINTSTNSFVHQFDTTKLEKVNDSINFKHRMDNIRQKFLTSKKANHRLESNIPAAPSFTSGINNFKDKPAQQHDSFHTNNRISHLRHENKNALNVCVLKRAQSSVSFQQPSSKFQPAGTESLSTPTTEFHNAYSPFPTRIPRAVSINGMTNFLTHRDTQTHTLKPSSSSYCIRPSTSTQFSVTKNRRD